MDITNESAKKAQTKRIIVEKFAELLAVKSIKKISVNDICEKALMCRSTFYLHFSDKYAVLKYWLERDYTLLESAVIDKSIEEFIYCALEHFQSEKTLYINAFVVETSEELIAIFQNTIYNLFYKLLKRKQDKTGQVPEPLSLTSSYCAGAFASSIFYWLINEPDTKIEVVAELLKKLMPEWTH